MFDLADKRALVTGAPGRLGAPLAATLAGAVAPVGLGGRQAEAPARVCVAIGDRAAGDAMVKRIPQRRLGRMDDLDGPLLLLCADAGRYMTGTMRVVDGSHLVSTL